MKFIFNQPQKFILKSALKDARSGVIEEDIDKEYKASIIRKIDRTMNQLDYNSYISNISEEVAGQFYELLQSVVHILNNTDRSEFDEDQKEDIELKINTTNELIEVFAKYNEYLDDRETHLDGLIEAVNAIAKKYDLYKVKANTCSFCDKPAYYGTKRFGKVCKEHRDQLRNKAQQIQEELDQATSIH